MRGKAFEKGYDKFTERITPAYAGKSIVDSFGKQCPEDHPRLCGEKTSFGVSMKIILGSPPPMRGKVSHSANSGFPVRITPAYAGKRMLYQRQLCGA